MLGLLAATASADPPRKALPKPTIVPEMRGTSEAQRDIELGVDPWSSDAVISAPSFGGGTSRGMVIDPWWHTDMRPYADGGMVIRPPWTGDDMVIAPGTRDLVTGGPYRRLWSWLKLGANKMLQALIPSAGST